MSHAGMRKFLYDMTRLQPHSNFTEQAEDLYKYTDSKLNKKDQHDATVEKKHDPFHLKPPRPEGKNKEEQENLSHSLDALYVVNRIQVLALEENSF